MRLQHGKAVAFPSEQSGVITQLEKKRHLPASYLPLLSRTDAEVAHQRTLNSLAFAQRHSVGRAVLRLLAGRIPSEAVHLFGLTFPNLLGVAAGFDKDAHVPSGLAMLGFGHIEIGTITPEPQRRQP